MSAEPPPALEVGVLGPLVLRIDGRPVEVPGARRRALLAVLALEAGRTVGTERLIDALWDGAPPANAVQALYSHVSRLRAHLAPYGDRLRRTTAGYRLDLRPDELDAHEVRRLAREAGAPGLAPGPVAALTRAALARWRGRSLEEFLTLPDLATEAVGLEGLRLQLGDDLAEARLALGDRSVSADLARAAAAAPLRERTALLWVRSLAAEGRTAEAMAAAQEYRRRLAEETGLDPGPALAELEQRVASGDLAPAAPGTVGPGGPGGAGRPGRVVRRPDGPLVGRRRDREEVLRLLGENATVTVTGPGGVGKTRLALDVVADPAAAPRDPLDGSVGDVVVVDLAAVERPERVCSAVASTLGLRTAETVDADGVATALRDRVLLLLLDNCEHLPTACRDLVVALRRFAPGVRVLATSRVTLQVPGEYVVRLQPLPVPRDAADLTALTRQPAVRAFVEYARRRRPDFDLAQADVPDLLEVLRRLDGLPLGIELAARQAALMPLTAVRERLDRALDLATGRTDADDERQRTLRATIDSSYRLLSEPERSFLRRLAPFPAGADLSTAEWLAGESGGGGDPLDLLHRLVDASLVVADAEAGRYRLLFTVRAFLLDELSRDGGLAQAELRFLERSLVVAGQIGRDVLGPGEPAADRRLRAELANLRAARDVAAALGRHDVRVELSVALADAATWRDLRELWSWALELAEDPHLEGHPQRAAVLGAAAEAARLLGDLQRASRLADEAFAVAGVDPEPVQVRQAWAARGSVAHMRGDFDAARADWLCAGRARGTVAAPWLASAALAAAYGGDAEAARALLAEARGSLEQTRCPSHEAFAAYVDGEIRSRERVEDAVPCYLDAIAGARRAGAVFVEGVARVALASARGRLGEVAGAAAEFGDLLDSWRRTGHTTQLWTTARNAASLLAATGSHRIAALVLLCAEAQPGAAAVSAAIARTSGRAFLPVSDLVGAEGRAELEAEAARLGPGGVLDLARGQLAALARSADPVPQPERTQEHQATEQPPER